MGSYQRTEKKYLVTTTKRMVPRTSLRYRFSKLNQPGGMFSLSGGQFNPHLKHWAVMFIILSFVIAIPVWASQPGNGLFHSYSGGTVDPQTILWRSSAGLTGEFNSILASSRASGQCFNNNAHPCNRLSSNSTNTAVMITNSTVGELSLASGKMLQFQFMWDTTAGCCAVNKAFGWFLTSNNTIPHFQNYNPNNDKSVVMLNTIFNNGAGSTSYFLYIQRQAGLTIVSQDSGSCGSSGDCYLSQNLGITPTTNVETIQLDLNETGNTGTTGCTGAGLGGGCSYVCVGEGPVAPQALSGCTSTQIIPGLSLANQYYLGFYELPNVGAPIEFFTDSACSGSTLFCMNDVVNLLNSQIAVPSATFDTGGFFGPIIKALISIGVFIAQNLFNFATFLWNILQPFFTSIMNLLVPILATLVTIILGVIKAILDAIGNAVGLGPIGTNLFTFMGDIAGFFTTFFANSLAQLSSFITFLVNGYAAVSASFSTYWTDVANWTTGLKDFLGGLWTIAGQLFTISFAFMFSGWLLYGAKRFSDGVGEGMEWFGLTRQFLMLGVAIALFVFTITLHYVLIPGFHMVQSIGEAKKTAEPDIEIGGTGVG